MPPGFELLEFESLSSTSSYIRENFAELRGRLPLAVTAREQTAGRGRGKRRWFSGADLGLYISILDRVDPRGAQLLALRGGLAVISFLESLYPGSYALKWPNDVLAGGKKVAGILTENIFFRGDCFSVIGIGINLNHSATDLGRELRQSASSLRILSGKRFLSGDVVPALLESYREQRESLGNDAVVARANVLAGDFRGRRVVLLVNGKRAQGVFAGIGPGGGLLLRGRAEIFHAERVRFDS